LAVADQLVDHVPVTDEVDLHQFRTIGDAGGGNSASTGPPTILGRVDRRRSRRSNLDSAAQTRPSTGA